MQKGSDHAAICLALGETLRSLRHRTGIAQEKIARKANIDRGYLSRLEGGRHSTTLDTILKLLDALGVSFEEFAAEFAKALRRSHARRATTGR